MVISYDISKYKSIDISIFRWIGFSKTFFTFFQLCSSLRTKGDHSPQLELTLEVAGMMILEINWYDIRHKEDVNDYST